MRLTLICAPGLRHVLMKRMVTPQRSFSSSIWAAERSMKDKSQELKHIMEPVPLEAVRERFTPEERLAAAQQRIAGLGPVVSKLPEKWIPYAELMRLEKPVGTWLLYLPCAWAISIAAFTTGAPLTLTLFNLGVFGVGSLIMRGFGCTINDLLDARLDSQVLRTIERPVASGRVSPQQALAFLGAQLGVGLGVILCLPLSCFVLGAISLVPVCIYPLCKRFTYYPQAVLSLAFNWGALLGFPAMGVWDWSVMIPLFASSWFWTMTYDTVYAHQDKKFDVDAGIKSTALAWGNNTKKVFTGLIGAQLTALSIAAANAGMLYTPGFIVGASIFSYRIISSVIKVDLDDPKQCWNTFCGNINSGLYLAAGFFFDYLLKIFGFL